MKAKEHQFLNEMKRNGTLYLMCLPALIFLIAFAYLPMPGLWMAFTDFNVVDGIFGSKFVGLDNFRYFFEGNKTALQVVGNTLIINVWGLILGLIFPITIAIFFKELKGNLFKRITQGAMFFPYFLSWVVVGASIYGFLATDVGIINRCLVSLGLQPVKWYSSPDHWRAIVIFSNIWKWSGYNSIIYLAAMEHFDDSLYEAAEIDGANKFHRVIYLTIPMLKPTAVVLTLMSVGRIFFGDRDMIIGIIGNNPVIGDKVNVIDTYVYHSMRTMGFSYSTAIGLFQSFMGLIMVIIANSLAKKVNDGEGLF